MSNTSPFAIENIEAAEKSLYRGNIMGAVGANPDEAAQAINLSRKTGIPYEAVSANLQDVQKRDRQDEAFAWVDDKPVTQRFLMDRQNADVAHDDLENMGVLEKVFDTFVRAGRNLGAGVTFDASSGFWGAVEVGVKNIAPLADPLAGTILPENPLRRIASGLEGWRKNQQQMAEAVAGNNEGAGFFERGVYSGLRSVGQMAPGTIAAVATGNPVYSLGSAGLFSGSQAATRGLDAGLSPSRALLYGMQDATAEVATEMAPTFRLLKDLKVGTPFMKLLMNQMVSEIPSEMLATTWQKYNEWMNLNPEKTLSDVLGEMPEELGQTVIATATMVLFTAGLGKAANSVFNRQEAAAQAQEDAGTLQNINEAVANSKLRERDPDTFRAFVGAASEGSPVQDVYINANTLLQSGVADQLAAVSPAVAEQYAEAVQTGGDVRIPIAEYTASIAGTELNQALVDHWKTEPGGMSPAEVREFQQNYEQEFQQEVEDVLSQKDKDEAFRLSADAVRQNIRDQLDTAGRWTGSVNEDYAGMVSSFYAVQAARMGITPEQLFQQYPLNINAESIVGGNVLDQAAYHGSPHRFDRFSLDHIGSGEGAQAYGWGLYFAGNRQVAEWYRDRLAFDNFDSDAQKIRGKGVREWHDHWERLAHREKNPQKADVYYSAMSLMDDFDLNGFNREEVLKTAEEMEVSPEAIELFDSIAREFNAPGQLYEVDIPEDHEMIDWDSRLNDQPEAVKSIIEQLQMFAYEKFAASNDNMTRNLWEHVVASSERNPKGAELYGFVQDAFESELGNKNKAAQSTSELFNSLGVKGIRYLDGTSRHTNSVDDGSHNYVIFDDATVEIQNTYYQSGNNVVAQLTGDEISGENLFESAREYFKNNLQGTVINRAEIGEVRISGKGWEKFRSGLKIDPLKAKLTPAIKPIIESGEYHGRAELTKPRADDIVAFHYFSGNVQVGDQIVSVGVNVGEDSRGNLFYNLNHNPESLLRKQKAPSLPGEYARGSELLPDSDFTRVESRGSESTDTENDILEQSINTQDDGVNITILNKDIRGSFNPDTSTISLLKNADLSTFLHESGHFFLETQYALASEENAPEIIRQDMQTILDWFGVQDMETWGAMTLEEKREHHEKFARGFESYLYEGKAPSTALQEAFQRFRAWLIHVYKNIINPFNVELTDEVRGVFDRMLASTEEIDIAQRGRGMLPIFETAEQAGMTAEEFEAYRNLDIDASNEAIQNLQSRSLRDMAFIHNAHGREVSRIKKEFSERRKDIRRDVQEEVNAMPVYQAWNALRGRGGIKLSVDGLQDMYDGNESWQRLRDLRMTGKDGMHPDIAAEQFGFSSGDELVKSLIAAEQPRDVIESMTDERMLQQYGEMPDAAAVSRAADEAIHNDVRTRVVATEVNALARMTGGRKILKDAAKEYARQIVGRGRVRDIRPSQYSSAESRAAKAAEKARKAGDLQTAATEKRNQLIQNLATKAAYEAREDVEKGLRYLRKFTREGVRKNIDVEYRDQIDQMLEKYDLKARSLTAIDSRQSLRTWAQAQMNAGSIPSLPEYFLSPDEIRRYNAVVQSRGSDGNLIYADEEEQIKLLVEMMENKQPTPYQNISVDEFRGLVDTVRQIEHLGRQKNKIITSEGERKYQAVRDEMAGSVVSNARNSGQRRRTPTDVLGKSLQGIRNYGAQHIKASTWARVMDGGQENGAVWRYLIRPANEATTKETSMRAGAAGRLNGIWRPVSDKVSRSDRYGNGRHFDSIGESLNWEGRMAVALNFGNESNLQRLLDGNGWTIEQVLPILQSITSEEWNAVQQTWDMFESYRPEIAALEKRTTGVEPEWISPRPFSIQTADGQTINLNGGYYPVVYDPKLSTQARQQSKAKSAKEDLRAAYSVATTRKSFVMSRVDEVHGRPLLLSMQGLYSGLSDVIHDLSFREWVADANKLLGSTTIKNAIIEHYGDEALNELEKWRTDIVVGNKRLDNALEGWASTIRQNVSMAGLGFNLVSAALQPLGLTQSVARIGARWVGKGVGRYIANPIEASREANEKSQWMAERMRTRFRDLNEIRNQIEGQSVFREFAGKYGYFLMLRAQQVADVPTWWGGYEKAIAAGENEATAVALADRAVRESQGGGEEVDLASIERGGPMIKLFTVFYSFMNTRLNLAYASAKTAQSKGELVADMMMLFTVPLILEELVRTALKPGDDDREDLGDWAKWAVYAHIRAASDMFVGGREFSAAIDSAFGEGFGGYRGPSGLRMVGDVDNLAKQFERGEFDMSFWRALLNTAGTIGGLPSAQLNRLLTGSAALYEGDTESPLAPLLGHRKGR